MIEDLVARIDKQLAALAQERERLQAARAALESGEPQKKRPGRPPDSRNKPRAGGAR
jgi:hypothetical protein